MSRLSSSLCPLLSDKAVQQLEEAGIKTVYSFVSEQPSTLSEKTSLSLQDVLTVQRSLLATFAAFPITAANLWKEMRTNSAFLSTGFLSIDTLLGGGALTGELLEISGPPAAGKTQLCFSLSAQTIAHTKSSVVYIDTNGSFSPSRLEELVLIGSQCTANVLNKIRVFPITDVFQLSDFIWELQENMRGQVDEFYCHVHLIVIDSLSSLFAPFYGEQGSIHSLLSQLVRDLQVIAKDHSIAIVVKSDIPYCLCHSSIKYSSGLVLNDMKDSRHRPMLHRTWVSVPHVRLCIKPKSEDKNEGFEIVLEKSSRLRTGAKCSFSLN